MAAATSSSPISLTAKPSSKSPLPISRFSLPFSLTPQKDSSRLHRPLAISAVLNSPVNVAPPSPEKIDKNKTFVSRYAPDEPRKGADILVEALERQGVETVFAYPGGASMEIHQALTRSSTIRNVLPRHEQGGVFAAEGYARSSGKPGICIATSGPGATNLVSGLADAMLDSVPLVAITGQVPRRMIGTDAFQETPIVEVTRPVLYVGGGSLNSSEELGRFVELTGIPVASTLMGLGSYPCNDELSLQMLGMHGTVYANYAVEHSDLLLAFGVRFDDRVTGKLEAFASRAKIVHIDIDSAEIGKNKTPHVSVCGDVKLALQGMNKVLENRAEELKLDFGVWRSELSEQKQKFPLSFKTFGEAIPPQYAIQILDELTEGKAIISTGVGQHQMWAAQFYKYRKPRQWLSSSGLGAMGFGLPAAIGASVANPDAIVVDIDGDGSFIMNVQELATIRVENLPVKILLLNNQHLGMVMQWEDRFYKANRAHTYLGDPARENEIFPNMLQFAGACGIPAARVTKKEELREAIQTMLDTPGPYLLDVICPHQEHVLPMIPSGGTFKDVITEGDGRTKY
uniref:acetolactate synthase n=1 Tax=Brassica oleracea var. oleracea TaxID=109376 RepID=A0A0D3A960_BRAOL